MLRTLAGLIAPKARGLADQVVLVAVLLREVEEAKHREGPAALLARFRELGYAAPTRSPWARRRLASLIYRLDALLHGESNCYRRSLVQVALDPVAASQPFVLGLDVPATGAAGHAWLEGNERPAFDVEFRL